MAGFIKKNIYQKKHLYTLSKKILGIKNTISFHKELRLPLRTALAALHDMNLCADFVAHAAL